MNWYKKENNNLTLNIYVIPRSSKLEIVGIYNDSLKIKLKSPPQDNAANEELVRFLAEKLKIPKSNIKIIKGHKQKRKTIIISSCKHLILSYLVAELDLMLI
ncbi:MAG: YggU family protein [Candidatus Melainabacteria bacterium]|nr:YggU family protein [Candidatus Melainabacteria bacterium]